MKRIFAVFFLIFIFPIGLSFGYEPQWASAVKIKDGREGINLDENPNGAFVRRMVDVDLPGRNGFGIQIARTYNSLDYQKIPFWLMQGFGSNIFVQWLWTLSHMSTSGMSGGIGYGWSTDIGGSLLYVKQNYSGSLGNYDRRDIVIEIGGKSYRFFHDQNQWKNNLKGDFSEILVIDSSNEDAGFTLKLANGYKYYFSQYVFRRILDRDQGNMLNSMQYWDKFEKLFYLKKIENQYGDTIIYDYETAPNDLNQSSDWTLDGTSWTSSEISDSAHSSCELDKKKAENLVRNKLIYKSNHLYPAYQSNWTFWQWGFDRTTEWIRPARVNVIKDNFGREVHISYRANFPTNPNDVLSGTDLENYLKSSQIKTIQYKWPNDSQNYTDSQWQNITYTYYQDEGETGDFKKHLLKRVAFPTGKTEECTYTFYDQNLSDEYQDRGYFLTNLTTSEGMNINITYQYEDIYEQNTSWESLEAKALRSYLVKSVTFKTSAGLTQDYRWAYDHFFKIIAQLNRSSSSKISSKAYQTVYISTPLKNITQMYDLNGLLKIDETASFPNKWKTDFEYTGDNILKKKITTEEGLSKMFEILAFDLFGQPKQIQETGPNGINTRTFDYLYETDSTIRDKTIVKKQTFLGAIKGGYTITNLFNLGSFLPYERDQVLTNTDGIDSADKTIVRKYTYYSNNNLQRETLPTGQTIYYQYDANGLYPISKTYEDVGITLKTDMDFKTGLKLMEDEFNLTKIYSYYNDGRLKGIDIYDSYDHATGIGSKAASEGYGYDNLARKISFSDKKGSLNSVVYDGFGRLTNVTTAYDEKRDFVYSSWAQVETIQELLTVGANSSSSTQVKDRFGRITNQVNFDGTSFSYAYSNDGGLLKKSVTDSASNKTHYFYDALNHLKTVKRDHKKSDNTTETLTASYGYNDFGKMTSATGFNGKTEGYVYNDLGWLTQKTSSYKNAESFVYDKSGNLKQHTNGKGNAITYAGYDSLGNAGTVSFKDYDGQNMTYGFGYHNNVTDSGTERNGINQLWKIEIKKNNVTEYQTEYTYTYDGKIRRVITTQPFSSTIKYNYDALGNVIGVVDGKGQTTYVLDTNNRLQSITRGPKTLASYDYTANGFYFGFPKKIVLGNGAVVNYGYYHQGTSTYSPWISSLSGQNGGGTIFSRGYTYDAVGNPLTKQFSDTGKTSGTVAYTYNDLYEVTKIDYPGFSLFYDYDQGGNRTAATLPGGNLSYAVNATTGRTDSFTAGDASGNYGFDGNGNVTSRAIRHKDRPVKTLSLVFDDMNNVRKITDEEGIISDGLGYSLENNEFKADTQNRRYQRIKGGVVTDQFVWGAGNDVMQETDGSGTVKKTFIYTPNGERIAEESYTNSTAQYKYFLNDTLRTPIKMMDETGNVLSSYEMGPFGDMEFKQGKIAKSNLLGPVKVRDLNIKGVNTGLFQPQNSFFMNAAGGPWAMTGQEFTWEPAKASEPENRYKLTGHFEEKDLGIYHMVARLYDPVLGKFLQTDPAGPDYENPRSLNPFTYCENRPTVLVDPDGKTPMLIGAAIGGIAGGLGAGVGAYINGGTRSQVFKAAFYGVAAGAISGALFQPQGVLGAFAGGSIISSATGGFSGGAITHFQQVDSGYSDNYELANNTLKGAVAGAIAGAVSAPWGAAEMGAGIAGLVVGGEFGFAADLITSSIGSRYDFSPSLFDFDFSNSFFGRLNDTFWNGMDYYSRPDSYLPDYYLWND